ncbi:uncharacterized protein [Parasteatoda tepidariorum]|uniref:uncharacterized protein n=1 Tax=Parasteatoda tepidariorum TaxID=114398 RepID=UPI0039BD3C87
MNETLVSLITSKSRIAPIKSVTIPKLELCAAVLLSKLVKRVVSALKVTTIQELFPNQRSRHVPTDENPVDLVSRGVDPDKLLHNNLRWHGPKFLTENDYLNRTINYSEKHDEYYSELRNSPNGDFEDFPFVEIVKTKQKSTGPLTTSEYERAETFLVKKVQEQEFSFEIKSIKRSGSVPSNSKLKTLSPFSDDNDILRVGGRLGNTEFNFNKKHQAVHIELVSDLTSEAFIATLKRFTARRGKCAKLFSDNAKNFVGTNNEIKKLHEMVRKPDESLAAYLAAEGIEWKFIPPSSPNFGGLWEAAIKSFYVDDVLISENEGKINEIVEKLKEEYEMKNLGEPSYYLGINNGTIKLEYCPTKFMTADILIKPLPRPDFQKHRMKLKLQPYTDAEIKGGMEDKMIYEALFCNQEVWFLRTETLMSYDSHHM